MLSEMMPSRAAYVERIAKRYMERTSLSSEEATAWAECTMSEYERDEGEFGTLLDRHRWDESCAVEVADEALDCT